MDRASKPNPAAPPTDRPANRGRFAPGQSGNPHGRPKAESTELRKVLAERGRDVVEAVLDAATLGDMQAARLVLERLLPPLKPTAPMVILDDLDATASPLAIARALIAATAAGKLPPDIAGQLVAAIAAVCRIEDVEDLRARIDALEKATRPMIPANSKK